MKKIRPPNTQIIIAAPIYCPYCGVRHVDEDTWGHRAHTTHTCLSCIGEFDVCVVGMKED